MKNTNACVSSFFLLLLLLQSCSNAGSYTKPRPQKKDIITCPYPLQMQPSKQAYSDSQNKATTLIK